MTNRVVPIVLSVVFILVTAAALCASPPQQPANNNPSAVARFMQDYAYRHPAAGAPAPAPKNAVPAVVPNRLAPRIVQAHPLCSIPLQSIPVDPKKTFPMQQTQPPDIDAGSVRKPSAPTCDSTPARR
jgi:hypothetical protein